MKFPTNALCTIDSMLGSIRYSDTLSCHPPLRRFPFPIETMERTPSSNRVGCLLWQYHPLLVLEWLGSVQLQYRYRFTWREPYQSWIPRVVGQEREPIQGRLRQCYHLQSLHLPMQDGPSLFLQRYFPEAIVPQDLEFDRLHVGFRYYWNGLSGKNQLSEIFGVFIRGD